MRRRFLYCVALVPCLALSVAWCAPAQPPVQKKEKISTADELRTKLEMRVTPFEKALDANTNFKDVLEHISERYDVLIVVDQPAFRADNAVESVDDLPVRLPRMVGVKLSTVLGMLAAQINGTYRVRSDRIEITTSLRTHVENWTDRKLAPTVSANFSKVPLEQALKELADNGGISAVLDSARIGEAGKATITATFDNVPVDTAVQVVANLAGMRAIAIDNVFYVTRPDNVETLLEERQKMKHTPEQPPAKEKKPLG